MQNFKLLAPVAVILNLIYKIMVILCNEVPFHG
jgi:hypothetical protein